MGKNKKEKNNPEKEVKENIVEEVKNDVEKKEEIKVKEKNNEIVKKEKEVQKENKKEEVKVDKSLVKKVKKASNNDTKIIVGIVLAVIVIALGIFGFYFWKLNSESVATYDGGKVTSADYEVYYKTFAPMLEYYGYPASIIPEQIVNKAALDNIIVELAEKEGIVVSDEDKQKVEEIFNNKEQLETFTNQGIDISRMRKLYMNDYLISTYMKKLASEASDEDVINYIKTTNGENTELDLNQYNTSHILFKTTDSNNKALSDEEKEKKKQQAQAALDRVKKGEDFATVAKELSEDAGTKEDGGKYTLYADGNTMEQYEAAAKTLKDGEIYATLVETEAGFHIIKLDSKVENGRAKNESEREEYVDSKINSLAEERHLEVNKEALNKLVEKITGKKVEDENNTSSDSTTDQTNTENNNELNQSTSDETSESTENNAQQ